MPDLFHDDWHKLGTKNAARLCGPFAAAHTADSASNITFQNTNQLISTSTNTVSETARVCRSKHCAWIGTYLWLTWPVRVSRGRAGGGRQNSGSILPRTVPLLRCSSPSPRDLGPPVAGLKHLFVRFCRFRDTPCRACAGRRSGREFVSWHGCCPSEKRSPRETQCRGIGAEVWAVSDGSRAKPSRVELPEKEWGRDSEGGRQREGERESERARQTGGGEEGGKEVETGRE